MAASVADLEATQMISSECSLAAEEWVAWAEWEVEEAVEIHSAPDVVDSSLLEYCFSGLTFVQLRNGRP